MPLPIGSLGQRKFAKAHMQREMHTNSREHLAIRSLLGELLPCATLCPDRRSQNGKGSAIA
jgi:hypothetical protein